MDFCTVQREHELGRSTRIIDYYKDTIGSTVFVGSRLEIIAGEYRMYYMHITQQRFLSKWEVMQEYTGETRVEFKEDLSANK